MYCLAILSASVCAVYLNWAFVKLKGIGTATEEDIHGTTRGEVTTMNVSENILLFKMKSNVTFEKSLFGLKSK